MKPFLQGYLLCAAGFLALGDLLFPGLREGGNAAVTLSVGAAPITTAAYLQIQRDHRSTAGGWLLAALFLLMGGFLFAKVSGTVAHFHGLMRVAGCLCVLQALRTRPDLSVPVETEPSAPGSE